MARGAALGRAAVATISAQTSALPVKFDDLMREKRYCGMSAYAKSKRANVYRTLELARRAAGAPARALVIHPGSAMTGIQRHSGAATRPITPVLQPGTPEVAHLGRSSALTTSCTARRR